jgi:hypothetical protein
MGQQPFSGRTITAQGGKLIMTAAMKLCFGNLLVPNYVAGYLDLLSI